MPTIIVEDGTNVADANSYIDLDDLEAFATDRNYTLPTSDTDKEILILRAMDYIESKTFKGYRTNDDQSLKWPRSNVYVDCKLQDSDAIPLLLKNAVAQLVVEQQAGVPLYPEPKTSTTEGFVTQSTVGPLTEKYFSNSSSVASSVSPIIIASVMVFLRPLLCGQNPRTVRV